jgi:hypothetical protein
MDFALRVGPVLADPLGPVEGGKHQDVEQFGARGASASRRPRCRRSSWSGLTAAGYALESSRHVCPSSQRNPIVRLKAPVLSS